jgi:hypothetical protein
MQTHVRARSNSYQVLTLAFEGQGESNPSTCYVPYLTKHASVFKLRAERDPQMLGPGRVAPQRVALACY